MLSRSPRNDFGFRKPDCGEPAGGTTVLGGTLQGDSASLQGNIFDQANVVFDQAGLGIYTGTISSTGSVTKQNSGTLILAGANTYSGGTTVLGGTLQGDSNSLQGNIADKATVSGGYKLSGKVTFRLYKNSKAHGKPVFTSTKSLSNGSAISASYKTKTTGKYYWVVTYSGNALNNRVASGKADERVSVHS